MSEDRMYNIKEISDIVDVPANTLKDWRKNNYLGSFIPVVHQGSHRKYPEDAIFVFKKIRDLRNDNVSLKNIALILAGQIKTVNQDKGKYESGHHAGGCIEGMEKNNTRPDKTDIAALTAALENLMTGINLQMNNLDIRMREVTEGLAALNTQGVRNLSRVKEELTEAWRQTAELVSQDQKRVGDLIDNMGRVATREQMDELLITLNEIKQAQAERENTIDNRISAVLQRMELRRTEQLEQQHKTKRWWAFWERDRGGVNHLVQ